MKTKNLKINYLILLLFFFQLSCNSQTNQSSNSIIDTSHLDFLYEEIKVNEKEMGIIHIYSDAPEYKWTGDDDEGIACVDDAARAAVFYLKHHQYYDDNESLKKANNLLQFILHMQSDNGYFYNFIWPDHSINKDFRTSIAEPNWWSWRALWALMEGYNFHNRNDNNFADELLISIKLIVKKIKNHLPQNLITNEIDGFSKPTWLPHQTASDQASVLLLALTSYYQIENDKEIYVYCKNLADGIILMQQGDSSSFPYGAFLSWENQWHGWGNLQAYSLLKFYQLNNYEPAKAAALKEVNNFYKYLIDQNYFEEFRIKKIDDKIIPSDIKKFPQIAYIIRPLIYSSLEAYKIMDDEKYAKQAGEIANWFFGKNIANALMYSAKTGRGYDGIISESKINNNSGAESTIEALLSLMEIENNVIAKSQLIISTKDKDK